MNRNLAALFAIVTLCPVVYSQSLSSENVGSSGGTFNNNGYNLSWSVGEIATETVGSSSFKLTQGFNQPKNTGTNSVRLLTATQTKLFPNPVSAVLHITSELVPVSSCKIYDAMGKLIWEQNLNQIKNTIDIAFLSSGTYVVSLVLQNDVTEKFQILKK